MLKRQVAGRVDRRRAKLKNVIAISNIVLEQPQEVVQRFGWEIAFSGSASKGTSRFQDG
jgi:hypothetical protein